VEFRTVPGPGFYPDCAVVAFQDAPTDSKTDSRTSVHFITMQPFKQTEYQMLVLFLNSDTIVRHHEVTETILYVSSDVDDRRQIRPAKLQGVLYQHFEDLFEMGAINGNGR
jgi:hypothetical protein